MSTKQKLISKTAFLALSLFVTFLVWLALGGIRLYTSRMRPAEAAFTLGGMLATTLMFHVVSGLANKHPKLSGPR